MMRVKSHILKREERGLMGLTFERLMGIGGGGFIAYLLTKPLQLTGFTVIFPLLIGTGIAAFCLSEPEGVPRYLAVFYSLRAGILLAARRQPESFLAQVIAYLGLESQSLVVNGDQLFYLDEQIEDDWSGVEILDEDDLDGGGYEIIMDDFIVLSD